MKQFLSNAAAYALMSAVAVNFAAKDAVLQGAIAISTQINPETIPKNVEDKIEAIVVSVKTRVPSGNKLALLSHMHDILYDEQMFHMEPEAPFKIQAQSIHNALEEGSGSYSVLAVIYYEVARRLGLDVHAISLPFFMMIAVNVDGKPLYVDVDTGRHLSIPELQEGVRLSGGKWEDRMLTPIDSRHWIARILQTSMRIANDSQDYAMLGALAELDILLYPEHYPLQKDLAAIYASMGHKDQAKSVLEELKAHQPDDPDVQSRLAALA
jgi:regulator of sirC expression with transglutaminase-like and TPR domain